MKRRGKLSIPDDQYNFLWVEEFPLFSFESASPGEAKRIATTHHPFTAPHPDDIDLLMSSDAEHDLLRVRYARVRSCVCGRACAMRCVRVSQTMFHRFSRGLHYDCVVNGVELGGGSIRVHNEVMQRYTFSSCAVCHVSCVVRRVSCVVCRVSCVVCRVSCVVCRVRRVCSVFASCT
jgi:aspartyl-tRNA synthetase